MTLLCFLLRTHCHVICREAEVESSDLESMLYDKPKKTAYAMLGSGGLPTPALLLKVSEYRPQPDSKIKWLQPTFFIRVSPVFLDIRLRSIWLIIII